MADENPEKVNQESSRTLTDGPIGRGRQRPRRSFLSGAATLLAGGAAALSAATMMAGWDAGATAGCACIYAVCLLLNC